MKSLSDKHLTELEHGSVISLEIIAERGYYTAEHPDDLPSAFANYQRRPGLVIPVRDTTGIVATHQLKGYQLRSGTDGKPIKYDTAKHGRHCLDIPLRSLPHLGNPSIPPWITEGAKKVDAGLSNGIPCIIGVLGVWGWRGTNEHGGKTVLPDWEDIALNGREVVLAFDSDVMAKASVRGALDRLSALLKQRGARVRYLLMPDLQNGVKCGLDDWFANGGGL